MNLPETPRPRMPAEVAIESASRGFTFAVVAATPWIGSVGAVEDAHGDLAWAAHHTTWADGKSITDEAYQHTAATGLLIAIPGVMADRKPYAVHRALAYPACQALYERVERIQDSLDFSRPFHGTLAKACALACVKKTDTAADEFLSKLPGRYAAIARATREVYQSRGTLTELQGDPAELMEAAAQGTDDFRVPDSFNYYGNGIIEEAYPLPNIADHPVTLPFYQQYIDGQQAAATVLRAFAEDVVTLRSSVSHL